MGRVPEIKGVPGNTLTPDLAIVPVTGADRLRCVARVAATKARV